MLIFVQGCRTIDKNLMSLYIKHRFWKNKWEQWNLQNGSLSYKIEFEKDSIWSSSEAAHQKLSTWSWSHQKLLTKSSLSEADVIRSIRSSEAEEWNIQVVKCCYSHAWHCRRNERLEQLLIQRNLKALDAYPLKNAEKGHNTIIQPLLHSSCLQ